MYTEAQFKRDSDIITKVLYIEAALYNQQNITKQAGVIVDWLKGFVDNVISEVKDRYQREGISSVATYVLNGLLPGRFKWLAVIVDNVFGISIGTIINTVLGKAKSIIDKNGVLTQSDVSNIVNNKVGSLEYFYQLEKRGEIASTLQKHAGRGSQESLLTALKSLAPGKSKSVVGGLVKWFIRLVLMGLVGVAVTEGPKAIVQEVAKDGPGTPAGAVIPKGTSQYQLPQKASHSFKSSGQGEQYHVNSGNTIWVVKLNGSLENTLLQWITMIYPELKGKETQIRNSPSFNTMVSRLKLAYNPAYPGYLQILPDSDLHTWRDIADRSIGDVV